MSENKRLKYEKPMSIDLGRVAPILGDTCSVGNGAADCPAGMNNATVAVCDPSGSGADNDCRTGSNAGTFCWPTGSGAVVYCLAGSGFGASSRSMPEPTSSGYDSPDSGGSDPYSTTLPGSEPSSPDSGGDRSSGL
jgi:hypothetical protein